MAQLREFTRTEPPSGNLVIQPVCPTISGDSSLDFALWALWKIVLDIAQSVAVVPCAGKESPGACAPAPPSVAAASPRADLRMHLGQGHFRRLLLDPDNFRQAVHHSHAEHSGQDTELHGRSPSSRERVVAIGGCNGCERLS